MKCALIFTLLAAATCSSWAAPFDLNDLFLGLPRNARVEQQPAQDVFKRQVVANPDGELKQVSFNALIGNLENSLFQSALSLNGASAPDSEVTEVKPDEDNVEHSVNKRSDEPLAAAETIVLPADGQERKILVQTTKKVPLSDEGVPAHLIIDHVSVLPQAGPSVPLIPTFQVHRTKITSATITEDANNDPSDGKQTKISITKTSITSTAPVESLEAQGNSTNAESAGASTTEKVITTNSEESKGSSTTTTITSTSTSTTAENPILKLKEVEEKLKAKVAEVEANPVILTARV
ncbi:uncharacterized protein LOC115771108 [Drosophila novamexicana]|uniref:uncharacterized protein LOC115771108 n=1 Tax=Drosophila novamexicana TaxID=47314 RepID=UPI0011E5A446|nr:uncharacterized protein LOC115771108 [Drosophila novamexicana]